MWRSVDVGEEASKAAAVAGTTGEADVDGILDRKERVLALIRRLPLDFEGE
jgi:hypothetical protein